MFVHEFDWHAFTQQTTHNTQTANIDTQVTANLQKNRRRKKHWPLTGQCCGHMTSALQCRCHVRAEQAYHRAVHSWPQTLLGEARRSANVSLKNTTPSNPGPCSVQKNRRSPQHSGMFGVDYICFYRLQLLPQVWTPVFRFYARLRGALDLI